MSSKYFNEYMHFKVKCSHSGPHLNPKSFDEIKGSVHWTI